MSSKFKVVDYEPRKIALKFDISMLNMLIGYLFKKSVQITRKSLNNMKRLFDVIDEQAYEGNDQLESRLHFIKRALKAKLELGMENEDIILNYCKSDTYNKEIDEIVKNLEIYKRINYDEIKYINKAIEDRLKYIYLYYYKDRLYSTIERLDTGDYDNFKEINDEMEAICSKLITQMRTARILENVDSFSLDDSFDNVVTDIVNQLKDPSNILKTGIKQLNYILGGGYFSKRLYVYLGLPAGFKSGLLLKTAIDIKKYNKGLKTKKAGKKPCVLLLTMENTVQETVERIFNMTVTPDDIKNFTPKQVIKMLREEGQLTLMNEDDIDIVIKYYPNKSIDTTDLYTIIDDLLDEEKEVVALILDYIKRIKPTKLSRDEKEELKNVTDELKNLAVEKNIPVITAHQLNRQGAATIDAAMLNNKEDLGRFLGRANVGSSWEVIENSDWASVLNVEQKKSTGQYYLTFKRIKARYKCPEGLGYFNHPFEMGGKIRLIDDFDLEESISEDSLKSDFEGVDFSENRGKRSATKREIVDDNAEDIFDFSSSPIFVYKTKTVHVNDDVIVIIGDESTNLLGLKTFEPYNDRVFKEIKQRSNERCTVLGF